MKMKNIARIASIVLVISMLLMAISPIVFGATGAPDPNGYTGKETDVAGIENVGGQIITIVSVVGSLAAVVVLVVLGIKYMMGSAEEKAEYKKTLLPYIIGAALVFAASALAGMVYNFAHSITRG